MIASCARSTSMSLTSEARSISVASNIKIASKYFRTNDGVRLHYLEAGGGKPLVLVHGFSQTAEQFKFQIEGLADRYRGDRARSTRPWRIAETELRSQDTPPCRGLARSAHRRESDDATLLGHSMGRSVIWAY